MFLVGGIHLMACECSSALYYEEGRSDAHGIRSWIQKNIGCSEFARSLQVKLTRLKKWMTESNQRRPNLVLKMKRVDKAIA